jgi:hypothetical protein
MLLSYAAGTTRITNLYPSPTTTTAFLSANCGLARLKEGNIVGDVTVHLLFPFVLVGSAKKGVLESDVMHLPTKSRGRIAIMQVSGRDPSVIIEQCKRGDCLSIRVAYVSIDKSITVLRVSQRREK